MSVDRNSPPPDNQGENPSPDDSVDPPTLEQMAIQLVSVAMGLALIDLVIPLNLEAYFVSILGAYGGYLLLQSGRPQPPTGLMAA
ncbi:hypothetical protein ACFWZS_03480 [[Kitasatospora] papulosa]|uniref:hypothetical protein n=1 Tax=[Kitasatospora] papulosa TaxID=1464011 RepID=UPI0036C94706